MPTPTALLYVNSTITRPESLTPEIFTDWYQDEHIPDIFKTSGIKSAFRYKSTDPNDPRPYLALYPTIEVAWLDSTEFKAIPVHSEKYLPKHEDGTPGGIFEYADFDTRYYDLVETIGDQVRKDEAGHLYTVCSDQHTTIPSLVGDSFFRRAQHFRLTFARQNRLPNEEKKLPDPPAYCAIYEFTEKPKLELEDAVKGIDGPVEAKEFTLLKAFSA